MKKAALALLASIAVVLGVTAGPSLAADPYANSVKTTTAVAAPSVVKDKTVFTVKIAVRSGSAKIDGKVAVAFAGKLVSARLNNGKAVAHFRAPNVKKGKKKVYKIAALYNGTGVYKDSKDSRYIIVKGR